MRNYDNYKDSGVDSIGRVPEKWIVTLIKNTLEIPITDGPHTTPELLDEGIPFISAESIKNGKIDFERKRGNISNEDHEFFSRKYIPQRNDIFMVKSGATTGNVAMVETDNIFTIWSPLAVFRANQGKLIPKFLHFYLQSNSFKSLVEINWSYGTQQNIGMGVLSNLPITYPTLSEQVSIAAFLDHKTTQIDALIEKKEQLIEKLKLKRQSIINEAVTGKKVWNGHAWTEPAEVKDSGIEWLGDIPEHWDIVNLKYLVRDSLQYGANESAELDDPLLPRYIRITDFGDDGKLKSETFKSLPFEKAEGYYLKDGDILFARSGATVGKTFHFKNYKDAACFAGYLIKARADTSKLLSEYLYLYTKTGVYENWKKRIFNQATIQNIGADKYKELPIILPDLEVQRKIALHLEDITSKIDVIIEKVIFSTDKLKLYRQSLISEAVTGKIDVRDWEETLK